MSRFDLNNLVALDSQYELIKWKIILKGKKLNSYMFYGVPFLLPNTTKDCILYKSAKYMYIQFW